MNRALWSARDIAAATGGRARGDWSVVDVSIDSRTVEPGELFVALRGPRHDGHDFVMQALQRGAAALVHRVPRRLSGAAPLVVVDDTMEALTALGRAGRERSRARIAAITGSVGKTGTKEALRRALESQGPTHASAASHNNHWGVPLSLARTPAAAAYGVFELGMNAPGEIDTLARMVRPHVALITTVEAAHIGFFRSLDEIADAKGEIFRGLEPGGVAVLNADNPHFGQLRRLAEAAGAARIIGFGRSPEAGARAVSAQRDGAGSDVVMTLDGTRIAYRVGAPGEHWVINSLAVIAAVAALGADPAQAAASLAGFEAPKGRGRRHRLPWRGGVVTLIDESYNANPASVRAALDVLHGLPGRRIAALGDMLELGEQAPALHAALADPIVDAGVDRVHTVGSAMRHLHDALPKAGRGTHVGDAMDLLPILEAELRPGDVLLIKGSLGIAMGPLVEALLNVRQPKAMADAQGE